MVASPADATRLPADAMRRICDPAGLAFDTTADIDALDGSVGQDRALNSLNFGLEIDAEGYNLFVSGPPGTGRSSTLLSVLRPIAQTQPRPSDLCYVYNFQEPRQPAAVQLDSGQGRVFADDMARFISTCRQQVPRIFEDDSYLQRREDLTEQFQTERQGILEELEAEAGKRGFTVSVGPMGVATIPLKQDGQPMSPEEFNQIPQEAKDELQRRSEELKSFVSDAMKRVQRLEKSFRERFAELDESVVLFTLRPLLEELEDTYRGHSKIMAYLHQVQADILDHTVAFRATETDQGALPFMRQQVEEFFDRYEVNVIVSQDHGAGAPVIVETNPTYYNLFGRIDYRSQLGAVTTAHTMIKAGAFHRANGGYLVLQAYDVLAAPLVWQTLKRTIRSQELRMENFGEQYSAVPVATLTPEPVPLDVKVVLVGTPYVYQVLRQYDEDFRRLFRARADFGVDMPRDEQCIGLYARFIRTRVADCSLRHFDRSAVARIVDHGSRLVENQDKLSTRFIDIADLLTEADFWAGKAKSETVTAEHVEHAIEEKTYRSNLIEERVHEFIETGTIRIDTTAEIVGQVNGIAVLDLGDYSFGRPSKITARVSLGRGQVVNIERESQMSGKIHSKAFTILNGYLHGKYGQERLLSLSASIGFEQTYDEIEGDSASAAELYALLSSLADVPVRQGIAVTGSINQLGHVQAIGGVNEKIEGWYAVCKARGLTGDQGVVIPADNVKHLMLKEEVVHAVEAGEFNVWAASHVDQGIEILTGVAAGEPDARGRYPTDTINRRVTDRFAKMSRQIEPRRRRTKAQQNETNASELG